MLRNKHGKLDCAWSLFDLSSTYESGRMQVMWDISELNLGLVREEVESGDCLTVTQKVLEHYISNGVCNARNLLVCRDCIEVTPRGADMIEESSRSPYKAWCFDWLTINVQVINVLSQMHKFLPVCLKLHSLTVQHYSISVNWGL